MKKRKFLLIAAVIFASLLLVLLLCRLFWLQPMRVAAYSMSPTLQKGDLILVDKLVYSFSKPKKGDVVFISTAGLPAENFFGENLIKRVHAVPEETVSFRGPYPASFKLGTNFYDPNEKESYDAPLKSETNEITLSADQYFLVGDNFPDSHDSRHFGPVKSSNIIGKVVYILAPADRRGPVK